MMQKPAGESGGRHPGSWRDDTVPVRRVFVATITLLGA
jgi:hypothetical protein